MRRLQFVALNSFKLYLGNYLAGQFLDGVQVLAVLGRGDGEGPAWATGPPGAADAVDVILGMGRHVEIEDVAHFRDVEAAGGDVGTDQKLELAGLEFAQGLGAHRLRHVAVQPEGFEPMAGQRPVDGIDVALAVAEYQRVFGLFLADQLTERGPLFLLAAAGAPPVPVFDHDHALDNVVRRRRRRRDVDFLRVHQEIVGEAADFRWHGGGEEKGVADRRQQSDDSLDVGNEAHVQHPVGFVDDQDLDVVHQQVAAVEQIDQAPRRRDQHVHPPFDDLDLLVQGMAADQQRLGQLVVFAVGLEAFRHLGRQFPCRFQDQRPGHPGLGPAGGKDVDHRQRETGGLAGAGLGTAENVAAHENHGDGLFLDWGGLGVARVADGAQDSVAQAQFTEAHESRF